MMWKRVSTRLRARARRLAGEFRFRFSGSPRLRRTTLAALKALGGGVGYAAFVEPQLIETSLIEIPIVGLPASLDGYTIAHLSDIHYNITAAERFLRRVVIKTNALDADMVALTGDFITLNPGNLDRCFALLSDLRAPDGCWVVRGNHDHKATAAEFRAACRAAGHRYLENEHVVIRPVRSRSDAPASPLVIAGVDDLWEGQCHPGIALRHAPDNVVTIMLSHNPQAANLITASHRVDLMLSGHTHGGQFRPMGRSLKFLSDGSGRYTAGLVQADQTRVYISRGVGTSAFRLRWNCCPEIALVRLTRAAQ